MALFRRNRYSPKSVHEQPVGKAKGSYCDKNQEVHKDYLSNESSDEIDFSIMESEERGDEVVFIGDWEDEAVNYRLDEYGNSIEHGPKQGAT